MGASTRSAAMPPRPKARRTHLLGSCKTCRRRHVRCDTKRPACQTCAALGLTCEGFADEIQWTPPRKRSRAVIKDGPVACFGIRRQLFTEQDRRLMGVALSKGLLRGSVDASLDEIDLLSKDLCCATAQEARIGPFSVLDISPASTKLQDTHLNPALGEPGLDIALTAARPQPVPEVSAPSLDDLLEWADLLELDTDLPPFDPESLFDFAAASPFDASLVGSSSTPCPTFDDSEVQPKSLEDGVHQQTASGRSDPSHDLLKHASELLKNFQKSVIPQMTTVPLSNKSPWEIINMSAALLTLGELTVTQYEHVTHARQAHLYIILACSAIDIAMKPSLDSNDPLSNYWKQLADRGYEEAKYHMRISLSEETGSPRKAKLKDQLMALYGMTEFAIFSGQDRDARRCLVDAERLLRLRCLPKRRVSRKLRLLINVYTWLRIAGESTYVLHDYSLSNSYYNAFNIYNHSQPQRSTAPTNNERSIPRTIQGIRLDDFLHIEKSENDLNIDEPKCQRADLTDIHLQDSRLSTETLGKQVYGIPETWLSLLSQTTRLGNVMEAVRNGQNTDIVMSCNTHQALQDRASRLESAIHSFGARGIKPGTHPTEHGHHHAMNYALVLQAFNSALLIFFYRRVRQIHPAILQNEVEHVIVALSAFHSGLSEKDPLGPGTLWPIFVAGCEATTSAQRESIIQLLEKAKLKSGLAPFKIAENMIFEVWRRQDAQLAANRREPLPTWIDVSKNQGIWPMFC